MTRSVTFPNRVSVGMTDSMLERVEKLARVDHRSRESMLRRLILEALAERLLRGDSVMPARVNHGDHEVKP